MESHKIQKTGKFEYKILTENHLKELINLLIKYEQEIDEERTDLHMIVRFKDGSSHAGPYASILDDTKLVQSVHLSIKNYRIVKIINIDIRSTQGEYEVESNDKDWVDAKFSQLSELFNKLPNQNKWFSQYTKQSLIVSLVGITLGLLLYYSISSQLVDAEGATNVIQSFGFIWGMIILGQLISHILLHQGLFKLYPVIEFDTTQEHINRNKKRKNAFWTILIIVGVPLTLNIITSLIF